MRHASADIAQEYPAWERFAGLCRGRRGDQQIVVLDEQLVIPTPNGSDLDDPVSLEPLGNGRFRLAAPTGGGSVHGALGGERHMTSARRRMRECDPVMPVELTAALTKEKGRADQPSQATHPPRRGENGAGHEGRTRDIYLGKVALYH